MFCEEEEADKSFCYVQGVLEDERYATEREEIHENVWYKMKPPKRSRQIYMPYVSARQIALVRAVLTGKQTFKTDPPPPRLPVDVSPVPRAPPPPIFSIKKKKSSVKFMNKSIYD